MTISARPSPILARARTAGVALATAAMLALAPAVARAQQPAAQRCAAPEHRQFDFWAGDWEVRDTTGRVIGHNVVTPVHGGCALREEWRSAAGGTGSSFNAWNRARRQWHQTWVDGSGSLLLLDGALDPSGAMVLEGETPGPDGRAVRNRITWTPLPGGAVRQHWQVSRDGGTTWTTSFDGRYVRRGGAAG